MSGPKRAFDIMRGYVNREFDRLAGVERIDAEDELEAALTSVTPTTPAQVVPADEMLHARRILGVQENASLDEIRKVYEELNQRSDPSRFPVGSAEATQASTINRRVQWAYRKLTEKMDATQLRFKTLEID